MLCSLMLLAGCGQFAHETAQPSPAAQLMQGTPIPYTTRITIDELSGSAADSLRNAMSQASQLESLADEAPDSLLGLERRARVDQETALKLMHSLGYYNGKSTFALDGQPVQVTLTLTPGQQYTVGEVNIVYEPKPTVPQEFLNRTYETGILFRTEVVREAPRFPDTLLGIKTGSPALADPILEAVGRLTGSLQRQGYPFARVADTRYTLNKETQTLNIHIVLNAGPPALMGNIHVSGNDEVHSEYVERLRPWNYGTPWNSRLMEQYGDTLRQLGLFRSVLVKPAESKEAVLAHKTLPVSDSSSEQPLIPSDNQHAASQNTPSAMNTGGEQETTIASPIVLDVDVDVAESLFRTAGASARYATDVGYGVQGTWEHRNILGNGEPLLLKALLAQNEQSLSANFSKPAFGRTNQKLLAKLELGRKKTDAYTKTSAKGYLGVERKLTKIWWAELGAFVESGSIEENKKKRRFQFVGANLQLVRDTRTNLLNPRRGTRLVARISPVSGSYGGSFTAIAGSFEASIYYPLGTHLVLAGRLAMGGMLGSGYDKIPPSLRYYGGGGGSVRGYAYQSIGPRDANNDPEGGRSFQEINLEARIRVTDTISIVPFMDGGMVYPDSFPKFAEKLDWAVGLGLRYATPIGPVRFDLAYPLTHRKGDKRYQVYISIGQAF